MENSVDPDETACYEWSHLDLHCLQKYLYWSAGMKGLTSLHCVDSSTTTLWTDMFPISRVSGYFLYYYIL